MYCCGRFSLAVQALVVRRTCFPFCDEAGTAHTKVILFSVIVYARSPHCREKDGAGRGGVQGRGRKKSRTVKGPTLLSQADHWSAR